jgi:hypothetical protein
MYDNNGLWDSPGNLGLSLEIIAAVVGNSALVAFTTKNALISIIFFVKMSHPIIIIY